MQVDRLEVIIEAESKKASAELDKLINKLGQVSTAMRGATGLKLGGTSGVSSTTNSLSKYTSATSKAISGTRSLTSQISRLAFAFYSIKRIISGIGASIKKSMDFTETINLFQTSFKKIGMEEAESMGMEWGSSSADAFAKGYIDRAQKFNDLLTASLGLDPNTMMNYQAVFAQMSNSMGLVTDSAMNISESFTMLGNDIASLWNIDTKSAMQKLQSGLAGQIRPLRQLGIDISQTSLQYTAMKYGIDDNVISMSQAAKVQLRWLSVMEQAEVAFGDMAKTIDSPANQLRILKQQWDLLSRSIGNVFLPVVQTILPYVNAVVIALRNMINTLATAMGYELPDYTDSNIYTDVTTDIDGMTDATDEATKANEKLKKSMYSGDELNILSDGSGASGKVDSGSGYGVLDDAIADKTASYMAKFNEELAKMSDKAKILSDKITTFYEEVLVPLMGASVNDTVIAFFDAFESLLTAVNTFSSKFTTEDAKTIGGFFDDMSNWTLGGVSEWFTSLGKAFDSLTEFINNPSLKTFGTVLKDVFGAFLKSPVNSGVVGWLSQRVADVLDVDLETWFNTNVKPWIDPSNWGSLLNDGAEKGKSMAFAVTVVLATKWEDLKNDWDKLTVNMVGRTVDFIVNLPQTAEKLLEKWTLLTVGLIGKSVDFLIKIPQKWSELESVYVKLFEAFVGKTVNFMVRIPQIWDDLSPLFHAMFDKFVGKTVKFIANIPQTWKDLSALYYSLYNNFKGKTVEFAINLITSLGDIKGFVGALIKAINTEVLSKLTFTVDIPFTKNDWVWKAPLIPEITPSKKTKQYADGGFPTPGDLFIANEKNAELVGSMNGKPTVANNGQIEAGIEEAAYRGYIRAIADSGQGNGSNITVENKMYLEDDVVYRSYNRAKASNGMRFEPVKQGG